MKNIIKLHLSTIATLLILIAMISVGHSIIQWDFNFASHLEAVKEPKVVRLFALIYLFLLGFIYITIKTNK